MYGFPNCLFPKTLSLKTIVATGLALAQVGELSFILSKVGMSHGIGSEFYYQLFLAVSFISMACTPFLIAAIPSISLAASRIPFLLKLNKYSLEEKQKSMFEKSGHVVIIGYGISGEHVAVACKMSGLDYVILEMNPDIVNDAKIKNEPILFGDASHDFVLHQLNLKDAQSVAIAI